MDSSPTRLPHNTTPQSPVPGPLAALRPAAGQPPRVFEARVIGMTLLMGGGAAGAAGLGPLPHADRHTDTLPRYRAQLEIGGPLLRGPTLQLAVTTVMPLRMGQALQLAVDSGGRVHLLNPTQAPSVVASSPTAIRSADGPGPLPVQHSPPPTDSSGGELAPLRHWARLLLPQQQPLHELLPVMQRWLTGLSPAPSTSLSPELAAARQLAHRWLAQLPTPEQLSEPESLRNALRDSGIFTEAHWRQVLTQGSPPPPPDQKSLLLQLLQLLQGTARTPASNSSVPGEGHIPHGPLATARPGHAQAPPGDSSPESGPASEALLRQLNAAQARIQLHQVDSLASRQSAANETQPGNTSGWSFELPVRDGQQFSSLEIHIQRRGAGRKDPRQIRWSVDLRLDLHQFGRFSAQLNLLGHQVSATLWAEHADTHLRVQQHLAALRLSLEAVGVKVQRLDCRRGLAPSAQPAFRRQLVDVRT